MPRQCDFEQTLMGKFRRGSHTAGMGHSNVALGLVGTVFVLCGCGTRDNSSPAVQACGPSNCDHNVVVVGRGTGGSGSGADSGTSGSSITFDVVQFTGSSEGLDAWAPQNVAQLSGTFSVKVSGATGGVLSAAGSPPFAFTNVLADGRGWVSVTPSSDSGFLAGLYGIPLETGAGISVPLLRTTDLDFVYTLLSSKAMTLDPTKAQLVIKFVDSNRHGVSGLHVSNMGGDAIAYASQGNWLDSTTGANQVNTDASGRVVGINIPASATAGLFAYVSATGINLQGQQQTVPATFPILAGFVTYGTVLFL